MHNKKHIHNEKEQDMLPVSETANKGESKRREAAVEQAGVTLR